jgi:hypothetical protein
MKKSLFLSVLLVVFLLFGGAPASQATVYTLQDVNSTVQIDAGTQSGMNSWIVDGTSQLFQQWFWYRVGDTAEQSIDNLGLLHAQVTDTNGFTDSNVDTLNLVYGSLSTFTVDVTYQLRGGSAGSNRSDMVEGIVITNRSSSSMNFSFFQYTDFDLNGDSSDDTAEKTNANAIRQWDPMLVFNETVVTPSPSHWEIDSYPDIRTRLNDGLPTTLSDATSPYSGDVTWAFEWDVILAAGDSLIISKDKGLAPVPEPATMLLLGSGLIGLAGFGRKKLLKKA